METQFDPKYFSSDTQRKLLERVEKSGGIVTATNRLLVGINSNGGKAAMTFVSNKGLDSAASDYAAEVGPKPDPKSAPINTRPGKQEDGLFVSPDTSGGHGLDKKSFGPKARRAQRGGVDDKPAGESTPVKRADERQYTPSPTWQRWLKSADKPDGEFAHSANPTGVLENYTPSEDDDCGTILDLLMDAALNARCTATSEDRMVWLDSMLQLAHMACKTHLRLAGDEE